MRGLAMPDVCKYLKMKEDEPKATRLRFILLLYFVRAAGPVVLL